MESNELTSGRRKFLGNLATGAVAMGIGSLAAPLQSIANSNERISNADDPDEWFKKIKGKHRIVFDVTGPNETMPFAWPRVFLMTNELTGTLGKDSNVVVILRHNAIPYAMEDRLWAKYKFGDVFKIQDGTTKASAVRNPFWKPKAGDFQFPGIGQVAIGINELQESGVMFCACNMALTVYSAAIAQGMGLNADDVKKDFMSGILPGVQVVPSGVWAVGRAQEHGCAYCFAG
ncbi:MAG TPA: twin-arginine translocation signal domain-containing protein [Flavisolibacter sp.]|jgi:intracellular sulfur oxidation DsrE/DsrF family protein|nr:twin-arginine translocation signal domain-containing protein [Flavisolibacter sp.]